MKSFTAFLLLLLLAACTGFPTPETPTPMAAASERLEFESLTFPGHLWSPWMPPPEEGEATTVSAVLTLPESSGPVPAVVLTHGCAGITTAETAWAERLNELGIATLLVHSFGARHIPEVCTGQHRVNIASMLADAYGALDLLAGHPRVDASRIMIMGFSFGGRTALWASQERFQERYGRGSARFAAHLAFYPASCFIRLMEEERVSGGPIRIFHGEADDWIPVAPCREYVERLRAAGVDAAIFTYPGAGHAFDDPQTPEQTLINALSPGSCAFVEVEGKIVDPQTGREAGIDAPCVNRGGSIGYHAEAHRQAVDDVEAFLTTFFQLR